VTTGGEDESRPGRGRRVAPV